MLMASKEPIFLEVLWVIFFGLTLVIYPQLKSFSESIGQKEVIVKNKSYSRNWGASGGQKSITEQRQLVPILRPDDFMSFPQGTCVFINSHLKSGARGYIPWYIRKVNVSQKDQKMKMNAKPMVNQNYS